MAPAEHPVPPEHPVSPQHIVPPEPEPSTVPSQHTAPPEHTVEHPPPATAESIKAAKRAKEQAKAQAGAEKLLLANPGITDCVPPSGDVRAHALKRLFLACSL